MPHLWISKDGEPWSEFSLDALAGNRFEPLPGSERDMRLQRSGNDWVMLFGPDVAAAANGLPCTLRILSDRDEIVCWPPVEQRSHLRLVYSAERLAAVRPFHRAPDAGEVYCGRCKTPVDDGDLAVVCPKCGVPHHSTADSPCWTIAPKCNCCGRSTDLAAGFEWTPCNV
jgi:hypothetical protein